MLNTLLAHVVTNSGTFFSVVDPIHVRFRIQEGKNDQQKYKKVLQLYFFQKILVIKTLDPDSIEMLDPYPYSFNPDPQHCFFFLLVPVFIHHFLHG